MTLVDNNGREITAEELCASLAADLRAYTDLSAAEIEARCWERYPGVMRRWQLEDAARARSAQT